MQLCIDHFKVTPMTFIETLKFKCVCQKACTDFKF